MIFKKHLELEGQHAFLSPSNHHWINYDSEKLARSYLNYLATQRGTELHAHAANAIRLGVDLPQRNKTLNLYVNDGIRYRMLTEQPLYFSRNCFGTTDAISLKNNLLRIHDLKTGKVPASMDQLRIYAALTCLEYGYLPEKLNTELRIYQSDEVIVDHPHPDDISEIMETIRTFDKEIEELNAEEGFES